jgi:hypothetical protein
MDVGNEMDCLNTMDGGVVRIMPHDIGGLKKKDRNH